MAGPGGTEVGRVSVRVVPDTDRFRGMLRDRLRNLNQELRVEAVADADRLRRQLERGIRTASAGIRATVPVDFVPAVAILNARLRALVEAATRGVEVEVPVRLDRRGLAALGKGLGGGGGGSPGRWILGLTRGLTALTAALGAASSLVPLLGGLAQMLGQLSGAALLLPGALLAAGAAFATFKVATHGFADALDGDEEALAKLAPAARETVSALKSLGPAWSEVQRSVQGNFFKGFAAEVRSLGQTYLPVLKRGMGAVAEQMNLMARYASRALVEPAQVRSVDTIFTNLSASLEKARTSLGDFIAGFFQLGAIGSEYLPALGHWISDISERFREWVQQNPDQIRDLIDNAIKGFAELGSILGDIGYVIKQIFTGLGGGGNFLTSLGQTTKALADFFSTIEAQNALQTLGETMSVAGTAMREILLAALQALMPIISALAPFIQQFAQALSTALVGALEALGPPLAELVAALTEALGPILPVIAQAIIGLAQALAPVISALSPVVAMIGAALLPVMQQLEPLLTEVAMAIGDLLVQAIQSVAPVIPPLISAAGQIIAAILPLIPTILNIAQAVLPVFAARLASVVPVVEAVASVIEFLVPIIQLVADVITAVVAIFTGQWDVAQQACQRAVSRIGGFIQDAIGFFRALPGNIVSALGNVGNLLVGAGRAIMNGLLSGLKAAWNAVKGWVSSVAGWIRSLKGPLSYDKRLLIPAGRAIMDGLQDGLERNWRNVRSLVAGMAAEIAEPFANPIDIRMDAELDRHLGKLPASMNSEVRGVVAADDFGVDSAAIAGAVVAGLTGSTLRVDGNGVAKLVNKSNTRRARRG